MVGGQAYELLVRVGIQRSRRAHVRPAERGLDPRTLRALLMLWWILERIHAGLSVESKMRRPVGAVEAAEEETGHLLLGPCENIETAWLERRIGMVAAGFV